MEGVSSVALSKLFPNSTAFGERLLYQLGAQVVQHIFILTPNSSVPKKKAGQPGH